MLCIYYITHTYQSQYNIKKYEYICEKFSCVLQKLFLHNHNIYFEKPSNQPNREHRKDRQAYCR